MRARTASVERKTSETDVRLILNLDGHRQWQGSTGVAFLDHMLELLSCHSSWDLQLSSAGDTGVDDHHTVEDVGLVLGDAIKTALGTKRGIERYGSTILPMDEVLLAVAVDLSGRFVFRSDYRPGRDSLGGLSCEMVNHFFYSLALKAEMNLHFRFLDPGENDHHRIEAMFKGFARSMKQAVQVDLKRRGAIPSSKGTLSA